MYNTSVNSRPWCVSAGPSLVTLELLWCGHRGGYACVGRRHLGNLCAFPHFCSEPWTALSSLNFKNIKLLLLKNLKGLGNIDCHSISVTLMIEYSSVPSIMFNFWNHTWNKIVMIKCVQVRIFFSTENHYGHKYTKLFYVEIKGKTSK